MSSTIIDSSSLPFDPYATATSFDASQLVSLLQCSVRGISETPLTRPQQTYPEFSPVSIFDTEDFGTDFTSDSAASPLSPLSPALSASSFGFPTTDAWTAWDTAELSPEPENLFACQPFASCPPSASNPCLSPAINPMDLAVPAPFFQSPQVMLATVPTPAPTPSTDAAATARRYPSRGATKRKSTSSSPSDEPPAKSPTTTTHHIRRASSTTPKAKDTPAHTPATATTTTVLGPKKTAHNMIEKRYRTNLNDKITQLRDAVPSLRQMAVRSKAAAAAAETGEYDDAEDGLLMDFAGSAGAGGAKLNKATILSKATEYILQLERRNQGLETENGALRGRMEGLELLLMGRGPTVGVWN